ASGEDGRRVGIAADAQRATAGTRAEGGASTDGCGGKTSQCGRLDRQRILLEVTLDDHATAREQAQDAATHLDEDAGHLPVGGRWRRVERGRAAGTVPEDAVDHQRVEVNVEIERRAEALDHGHRAAPPSGDTRASSA